LSLRALRPASARESEHADHRASPHPFEIPPCLPIVIPLAIRADRRTVLHYAACDIHECRSTKTRDGCPDEFEPLVSSAVSPHLVAWRHERSFRGTPSSELIHEHRRLGACPWARQSDLESGNAHASLILTSFAASSLPNMVLLCRSGACCRWTATLLMSATDRYAEPGPPNFPSQCSQDSLVLAQDLLVHLATTTNTPRRTTLLLLLVLAARRGSSSSMEPTERALEAPLLSGPRPIRRTRHPPPSRESRSTVAPLESRSSSAPPTSWLARSRHSPTASRMSFTQDYLARLTENVASRRRPSRSLLLLPKVRLMPAQPADGAVVVVPPVVDVLLARRRRLSRNLTPRWTTTSPLARVTTRW
jgi:hypothetical protein